MSASRRQKRRTEIGESFITYKRSMLESPAFRVLSHAATRVMRRIELEHMNHGGAENGRLIVTFDQFVKWRIDRKAIAPAIRELVLLGFLEVTEQGHAGAAGNGKATRFRLTYVNCKTREQPSDEWRRIDTIEIAEAIVSATKREASPRARDLGKRSWRAKMEKNSVPKTEPSDENLSSENGTTRLSSKNGTTIYNLGGVPEQTEQPNTVVPFRSPPCDADLIWATTANRPLNALAQAARRVLH